MCVSACVQESVGVWLSGSPPKVEQNGERPLPSAGRSVRIARSAAFKEDANALSRGQIPIFIECFDSFIGVSREAIGLPGAGNGREWRHLRQVADE